MNNGLSHKLLKDITNLVIAHKKPEKIVLFGSRATGDFRITSDIDLAIYGKDWNDTDINLVKSDLDENIKTPLKFDVLNYYTLHKTKLKENINKHGVVIYDNRKN